MELATIADRLAARWDVTTIFTAQHVDLRLIAENTSNLFVAAQHMDPIAPGRGMGLICGENLVEAGASVVVLNHAEHTLGLDVLDATIARARELGLMSVVCADSDAQCRAIAMLKPTMMLCEPNANIGTGSMDPAYPHRTTALVKAIDPEILVIQAAGVTSAADITHALEAGADGSGSTSGIVCHPDWDEILSQMFEAVAGFRSHGQ